MFYVSINDSFFHVEIPKGFILGSTIKQLAAEHALWHRNNFEDVILRRTSDDKLIPLNDEDVLFLTSGTLERAPSGHMIRIYKVYTKVFLLSDATVIEKVSGEEEEELVHDRQGDSSEN